MLARTPLKDLPLKDQAIKWLETQDPNESYNWNDGTECACAKFAKSIGRYYEWRDFIDCCYIPHSESAAEWKELNIIAGGYQILRDRTFGKMLERLLSQ